MTERKKSRAINGDDILDPIDAVKQIIKLYNASDTDDKMAVQHLINKLNRKRPLIAYCDAYDNYYERLATVQLITDKNHNIQHVIWHTTNCEIWYNVDVETNTIEQRYDNYYERLATVQLITDKNHNIQHVIWHTTNCEIWYNVDVETNTIEQRMDGRYIHNVAIVYLDNGPFSHITLTDNTAITYRWMESIKMLNYACAQKFLDIKTMNGMELTINIDQIRYIIDRG